MLTMLIITTTVTALMLTVGALTILMGWFTRLAALTARGIDLLLSRSDRRLDLRERSELAARLWVPL